MRIFLTGPSGQVGSELRRTLALCGEVIAVDRSQLDLANNSAIGDVLQEIKPNLVVNAAAYTDVDGAEQEFEQAEAVNAVAPGVLAIEAKKLGAAFIHYSTDYVFDGSKDCPYTSDDQPNPINNYGRSKLAGEKAVAASKASWLILRTSWVHSLQGTNFVRSILRQSKVKSEIEVADDQVGNPTWSRVVAETTAEIVRHSLVQKNDSWNFSGNEGIYHLACEGSASWFEFAQRIVELAGPQPGPTVTPIASQEHFNIANRPRYSALNCDKTISTFNVVLPKWEVALEKSLEVGQLLTASPTGYRSREAS